jgi:hypothetical protein
MAAYSGGAGSLSGDRVLPTASGELEMTRILKTDEHGALTLPPDVLGEPGPHARFVLEVIDGDVLLRPAREATPDEGLSPAEWLKGLRELSVEIAAVWDTDQSVAQIMSGMRR